MPIRLNTPKHLPLDGLVIDTATIQAMVKAYRTNHSQDPNALKFIHFNLQEVIQLFIDNGVLDGDTTPNDQIDDLSTFGLKIYLGNHIKEITCPPKQVKQYMHKDTAILCNTSLDEDTKTWMDQLKSTSDDESKNNAITILGTGDGLDRGSICPPNCPPSADPDGYYHQDIGTAAL